MRGFGFMASGLGFRVQGLGPGLRVWGCRCEPWVTEFKVGDVGQGAYGVSQHRGSQPAEW